MTVESCDCFTNTQITINPSYHHWITISPSYHHCFTLPTHTNKILKSNHLLGFSQVDTLSSRTVDPTHSETLNTQPHVRQSKMAKLSVQPTLTDFCLYFLLYHPIAADIQQRILMGTMLATLAGQTLKWPVYIVEMARVHVVLPFKFLHMHNCTQRRHNTGILFAITTSMYLPSPKLDFSW